jgi:preprotein translocase subunit SecD
LDAQITTLIAAAVLFQFGTGPIKGFAVVLSIGILSSIFTAVFVTRTLFETWTQRATASRLSI